MHLPDDLALPNLAGDSTDSAREGGFMAVVTHEFEPALTPDDIGWLAGLSSLPVVAKGVQRADDAVRCVEAGAAAVVVSNHGARQLADAPATADILAEIVDAVAGRAEVYVDGGVRRSPDVVKALALGARAALVGRPSLWALATGGADGVAALLRWYEAELRRAMALCGAADGRRDRPQPGAADAGLGARGSAVVTTVAAMVAAGPRTTAPGSWTPPGSWTWRQAVAEGAARGALAAVADRRRHAPHRRAPAQRARVPVLAERRRAGGGGDRRDQPDHDGARRSPPTCGPPTAP